MPRIKFTDKGLKAIKPPASGQIDYWDATLPGFGLRVSAGGRRQFNVMFRVRDGGTWRKVRMKLGSTASTSLADARDAAKEALRIAEQGGNPLAERRDEQDAISFPDLADQYIEKHAKRHKRTWHRDKLMLDKDFVPAFKRRKAKDIRRRDILAVLNDIIDRGAPVSANRALEVVRSLYNWAISAEHVTANPCTGIKKPSKETARERNLSDDEIAVFWRGIDHPDMAERTALALRLLLVTGQRRGEVVGASLSEIDEAEALWTIPGARTKSGREHVCPLSPLALDIIRQIKATRGETTSPFLFPSPREKGKKPISGGAVEFALRFAVTGKPKTKKPKAPLPLAKLDHFTVHDLRRTCATGMRRLGTPRFVVGKVLSHADSGSVTGTHYDKHDALPEKRLALNGWAAHLCELLGIESDEQNIVRLRAG